MSVSGTKTSAGPKGGVTVVVTVLHDPRVARTLESLLLQDWKPETILVNDGDGTGEVRRIAEEFGARDPRIRHLVAPGTIPESRNLALREVRSEYVAFLDADEIAPPDWLTNLLRPFVDPWVGFTGGPTPAIPHTLGSVGARYYDGYLRRFYDRVARYRPHALPMGNSAWRMALFDDVGLLDTTLFPKAASEDQEIAVRALNHGWHGVFVPEAYVQHDFSQVTTLSFLRKQSRYAEGGFVVWRRRRTTYEASPLRVFPYVALPVAAVGGLVLLLISSTRLLGELLLLAVGIGFVVLAAGLTVQGLLEDRKYPGLRFRVLEIPRRWATLVGAFRGWLHYGWKGTRSRPRPVAEGSAPGKR